MYNHQVIDITNIWPVIDPRPDGVYLCTLVKLKGDDIVAAFVQYTFARLFNGN